MNFDVKQIAEYFVLFSALIGLVGGIVLFFKPKLMGTANQSMDTWYSGRKAFKSLEIMRETDSFYFKYNKAFGTIMLLGTLYLLYIFFTELKSFNPLIDDISGTQAHIFWEIALDTFRYFVITFSIAGIPIWLLLIFSPFTLQRINDVMNQWISSRMWLLKVEEMNYGVDGFAIRNHKPVGAMMVFASLLLLYYILN